MKEIYGYSESFKFFCNRRKQLVGVDAEKANFHARFFIPSVRSNQICFALKQSRVELRKKHFLIGITRHRFLKVYLSPRSRTFVSHRFVPCSFLFFPLSFQSNLLCSKAKPCGNTKETTAQISQSLLDSKTSSHCSRLDKCISQGKLSFLARPLRTDIETFQHEKSD